MGFFTETVLRVHLTPSGPGPTFSLVKGLARTVIEEGMRKMKLWKGFILKNKALGIVSQRLTPNTSSTYERYPLICNFPSTSPHGSVDVLERSSVDGTYAPQSWFKSTGSFMDRQFVIVRPSWRAVHDLLRCIDYEWKASQERESSCPKLRQYANFNNDEGRHCKNESLSGWCKHSRQCLNSSRFIFIETYSLLRRSCKGTTDFRTLPYNFARPGAKARVRG